MASASVVTAITTALTTLAQTPGALSALGNSGLTQANEFRAAQIIDAMQMTPAEAPQLLASLEAIQGVPAQTLSDVTEALNQPANFQMLMANAKASLMAAVSTGLASLV